MPKYTYQFKGDSPKIAAGQLVEPGASVTFLEPFLNGDFEPVSSDAKAFAQKVEADEKAAAEEKAAGALAVPPADSAGNPAKEGA